MAIGKDPDDATGPAYACDSSDACDLNVKTACDAACEGTLSFGILKSSLSSESSCKCGTYSVAATDEHGGMDGTAMSEDTIEESAGDTCDEHDSFSEKGGECIICIVPANGAVMTEVSTITEDPVDSIGTEPEDGLHEMAVGHPPLKIGKTGVAGDASYLDDGHNTAAIKADGCCTEITEACKVGVLDYVLSLVEL